MVLINCRKLEAHFNLIKTVSNYFFWQTNRSNLKYINFSILNDKEKQHMHICEATSGFVLTGFVKIVDNSLVDWCTENNLLLNASRTSELIVECWAAGNKHHWELISVITHYKGCTFYTTQDGLIPDQDPGHLLQRRNRNTTNCDGSSWPGTGRLYSGLIKTVQNITGTIYRESVTSVKWDVWSEPKDTKIQQPTSYSLFTLLPSDNRYRSEAAVPPDYTAASLLRLNSSSTLHHNNSFVLCSIGVVLFSAALFSNISYHLYAADIKLFSHLKPMSSINCLFWNTV